MDRWTVGGESRAASTALLQPDTARAKGVTRKSNRAMTGAHTSTVVICAPGTGFSRSASMTRPSICAAARGGPDGAAGNGVYIRGIRDSRSQPPQTTIVRAGATSSAIVRLIRLSHLSKRFRSADRPDENKNRSLCELYNVRQ